MNCATYESLSPIHVGKKSLDISSDSRSKHISLHDEYKMDLSIQALALQKVQQYSHPCNNGLKTVLPWALWVLKQLNIRNSQDQPVLGNDWKKRGIVGNEWGRLVTCDSDFLREVIWADWSDCSWSDRTRLIFSFSMATVLKADFSREWTAQRRVKRRLVSFTLHSYVSFLTTELIISTSTV